MKQLIVKVIIKENFGGHLNKLDTFEGSPEKVTDLLLKKYVGRTGWERLGNLIASEIKQ